MISDKTVYRMLDRNRLPAMRIGAQWRFRRQDIDAWLTEQARRVEFEGQRGALDVFETAEIAIQPLLAAQNIWLGLRPRSRDDLFAFMIHEAALDSDVDRQQLLRSILDREALCSTALVETAAFPHPLDPRPFHFSRKRVLLAVLDEPVHYSDPHHHRPGVIAMILARSRQGHLLALSRAIKLFGDADLSRRLHSAPEPAAAIALIGEAESRLAPGEADA